MTSVAASTAAPLVAQVGEAAVRPDHEDRHRQRRADQEDGPAEHQAVLEAEARAHAVEPRVALAHEVGAVGVGARARARGPGCRRSSAARRPSIAWTPHTRPSTCSSPTEIARTTVPSASSSAPGSMNRCVGLWTSRKRRCRQPSRKLESFDSPPRGWYSIGNSPDVEALLGGPDDHLGGELHAGRAQVEPGQDVAAQAAHAAVGVADAGAEEHVEHAGQHRVADVAVQPGHRARVDVVHPVAHDEVGAVLELLDEARDLAEVVGQVGVAHDDVLAARGGEARRGRPSRSRGAARGRRGRRRPRPARRSRPRRRCRRPRPRPRSRPPRARRAPCGRTPRCSRPR